MTPLILGYISAWHGGRFFSAKKAVINSAWCVPFAVLIGIYCPLWTLVFVPLCLLKAMAYGRFFDVYDPFKEGATPEKIEFVLKPILGVVSLPVYKCIGMAAVGFLAVSGAVLAFGVVNPLAGLIIAIGGLLKGVNHWAFNKDTAIREFADGCAAGCGLLMAVNLV